MSVDPQTMPSDIRVSFFGLGTMGGPMARNLARSGLSVSMCDVNADVVDRLVSQGFDATTDPITAARDRHLVFTILPTSPHVRDVFWGAHGIANVLAPRATCVDMSTGSVDAFQRLAADLADMGHVLVDAPVGRSVREAVSGKSLFMVGATKSEYEALVPILRTMSDKIVHAGPSGSGLRLKLINNYMAMINHVLTGEVLSLAERAALNLDVVVDTLTETSAGKGQLATNFPVKVLSGDVSPDFPVRMAIKDLNLALDLAAGLDASDRFGTLAVDLFRKAEQAGFSELDATSIFLFLKGVSAPRMDSEG